MTAEGPTYRDYSNIKSDNQNDPSFWLTQGIASKEPPFPMKLHAMLSHPDLQSIITWQPHGRSWRILKKKEFEEKVIPLYFSHNRYASFIAQVNGYGFRRITSGIDSNSYYHELFLRGMPNVCQKMRRLSAKDIRDQKKMMETAPPPDFYALSKEHSLPETSGTTTRRQRQPLAVDDTEVKVSGVAAHLASSSIPVPKACQPSMEEIYNSVMHSSGGKLPFALSHGGLGLPSLPTSARFSEEVIQSPVQTTLDDLLNTMTNSQGLINSIGRGLENFAPCSLGFGHLPSSLGSNPVFGSASQQLNNMILQSFLRNKFLNNARKTSNV